MRFLLPKSPGMEGKITVGSSNEFMSLWITILLGNISRKYIYKQDIFHFLKTFMSSSYYFNNPLWSMLNINDMLFWIKEKIFGKLNK